MEKGNLDSSVSRKLSDIDRIIHSPTRLKILIVLSTVEEADFTFIARAAELTRGNLSVNLQKLEAAGYVDIEKKFIARVPKTIVSLTKLGSEALHDYTETLSEVLDKLRKD